MLRVVAIGGGEIGRPGFDVETTAIDAEVVRLAGKAKPRVLFLGTAAQDDPAYFEIVTAHYGTRLGCEVTSLNLYDKAWDAETAAKEIEATDIVYVGGGNTLRMMKLWRRRGIDQALTQAAHRGTVMAGVSAGAICWASKGVSNSRAYSSSSDNWSYIAVRGLGLVDLLLCPHYDAQGAQGSQLPAMVARTKLAGLGLPDCTALQIVGNEWRTLSCREGATPQLISKSGQVRDVPASDRFQSLDGLTR